MEIDISYVIMGTGLVGATLARFVAAGEVLVIV